jgi:hypothetical protein
MPATVQVSDHCESTALIPPPAVIRTRLYRIRQEARLLTKLLRISEDHVRSQPQACDPVPAKGVAHVA